MFDFSLNVLQILCISQTSYEKKKVIEIWHVKQDYLFLLAFKELVKAPDFGYLEIIERS